MMEMILLNILIGSLGLAWLTLIRNKFTLRVQLAWNQGGYKWAMENIEKHMAEGVNYKWNDGIQDYMWVFFRFWKWNVDKFMKDEFIFNEVKPYFIREMDNED